MAVPIHYFDLTIEPNGTNYQVRFEREGGGESRSFPVNRDLVEQACDYGAELSQGRLTDNERASRYGKLLSQWFLPESVGPNLQEALAKVQQQRAQLRLCIRYPKDELLHEVPWELLCDPRSPHEYLALSPHVLLARYVCMEREVRSMSVDGPVHLLITAADAQARTLNLDAERQEIDISLRAELGGKVHRETLEHVNAERLRAAFLDAKSGEPIHIWHHAGHGRRDDASSVFQLVLENEGREEFLPATALADVVTQCPSLRLVILNVCHGGSSAGLASALAELNVPAVIGHRTRIEDWSAIRFTSSLYANLLHRPVDQAMREARRSLQSTRRTLDWALPILFLRTLEAELLPSRYREVTDFTETAAVPGKDTVATPNQKPKSNISVILKRATIEQDVKVKMKADSGHKSNVDVVVEDSKVRNIKIRES